MLPSELMRLASQARLQAYCPYSGFSVGAWLCSAGMERWSPAVMWKTPPIPWETALSEPPFLPPLPKEKGTFPLWPFREARSLIKAGDFALPAEPAGRFSGNFCSEDFPIFLSDPHGEIQTFLLGQLLPVSFGPEFSEKTDTL